MMTFEQFADNELYLYFRNHAKPAGYYTDITSVMTLHDIQHIAFQSFQKGMEYQKELAKTKEHKNKKENDK